MTDGVVSRLFTLQEVAERTGFALRTLQRDCRASRVAHVHRGRDRLMTEQQVQELIDRHTKIPAPPQPDAKLRAKTERLMRLAAKQAAKRT